jgi:hypothetical protein
VAVRQTAETATRLRAVIDPQVPVTRAARRGHAKPGTFSQVVRRQVTDQHLLIQEIDRKWKPVGQRRYGGRDRGRQHLPKRRNGARRPDQRSVEAKDDFADGAGRHAARNAPRGEQIDGLQALVVPAHRPSLGLGRSGRWQHSRRGHDRRPSARAVCRAGRRRRLHRSRMPSRSASPEATTGQRGWNRHPGGTWIGSGVSPVRICCSTCSCSGTTDSSALVYGCCGLASTSSAPQFDDPAEVHHGDVVGDVPCQAEVVGDGDDRGLLS